MIAAGPGKLITATRPAGGRGREPRTLRHGQAEEANARELLTAWRATNQPLTVFCRARNVSYHSLYRWRRVLDAKVPVLLEVKVAAPARPATYDVILAGGCVVRVADDFHGDTLARLVAALERAC